MPNASELEWGFRSVNLEAPALWGARMYVESWDKIEVAQGRRRSVTKRQLAILPDRKSLLGEEPARAQLCEALDAKGGLLDQLRALAAAGKLDEGMVARVFKIFSRGVEAHVRIYGGYVYVTAAWRGT